MLSSPGCAPWVVPSSVALEAAESWYWNPQVPTCIATRHGFQVACNVENQFGLHLAVECDTHRKRSRYFRVWFAKLNYPSSVFTDAAFPPPIIHQPSHVPFTRLRCVTGCSVTGCTELVRVAHIADTGRIPRNDGQDPSSIVANYL